MFISLFFLFGYLCRKDLCTYNHTRKIEATTKHLFLWNFTHLFHLTKAFSNGTEGTILVFAVFIQ